MPQFADRVKTTSTSTGSSAITLSSSSPSGYQAFPSSLDGETVGYVIESGTDWEIGTGVYTHSSLGLSRTLRSSSTGSLLNLGSGTHTVFLTPAAQDLQIVEAFSSTSDLPSASASHGRIYHVHGEGAMYFAHGGNWIKLANYSDITTYSNATTSADGLMSASDKTKLDGIETSADVTDTTNVVAALTAGTNITIASDGTISSSASGGGGGSSTSALTETTFSASANQTAFVVSGGITNASNVSVFRNGVKLEEGSTKDYTVNASTDTVTLNSGAAASDVVEVLEYGQPASSGGSGVTTYTNLTAINAVSSPSEGDLAYDLAADQLYIRTTSAWKRIALGVDETPVIITEPATTHNLNDDGSTSTVTMLASDPEGFGITYGIAYPNANNDLPSQLASATSINQTTGVYTFDPSETESHAGTVNVRLSASDGARTTTRIVALTLEFLPKWYGARGIIAGGRSSAVASMNTIEYFTINTGTFSSTDFGDLTGGYREIASCSDGARAVFAGGRLSGTPANTIQYVETGTTGNASDFGDMTTQVNGAAGVSNGTRGCFGGDASSNMIDVITIQTTGNAADFGNMTISANHRAGCSNATYGMFSGGWTTTSSNVIDRITISTNGNAVDHADLATARNNAAGMSSKEGRGIFGGGYSTSANTNTIDYIDIGGSSNASSFGTLTTSTASLAASSDGTYGLFLGGDASTYSDVVDKITIGTEANATDIGDLSVARREFTGTSGAAA